MSLSLSQRRFLARLLMPLALAFGALTLAPQGRAALAQPAACAQIRSELARLGNRGGPTRASQRLRRDLGRVQLALQNNDCSSRGFLGLGAPPPVCGPLRAQANALADRISAIEGDSGTERRAQLMSAYERYGCNAPQRVEARRQRGVLYAAPDDSPGLLERLFGTRTEVPVEAFPRSGVAPPGVTPFDESLPGETGPDEDNGAVRGSRGGSMAVCVRTCDGYFFPVNFEGLSARDEHAEVCKSLCPAAQTQVFYMSRGGEIENAATRDGTPYSSLPNAKKYQQGRDLSCICKQPGQTWASAMKGVPDLVEMRKGDIVVSPEQAAKMSLPKDFRSDSKGKTARQREALSKLSPPQETAPHAPAPLAPAQAERSRTPKVRIVAPHVTGAAPTAGSELRSGSGEARRP